LYFFARKAKTDFNSPAALPAIPNAVLPPNFPDLIALIGDADALFFTGIHLSVSAAIGFIALFGQAVLICASGALYGIYWRRAAAIAAAWRWPQQVREEIEVH
jgi:hypothetical protein